MSLVTSAATGLLPLRFERGLEERGKRRKEFTPSEGPLRAERAGASESLGRGEVVPLLLLLILFLLSTLLSPPLHAADCPSGLRIIARTGQSVGGQTLTTIRPGVSINDRSTIAFLVGPGISTGFDYCIPAEPPAIGCVETLSAAEVVFSLLAVNATDISRPARTLTYSYVTDAQNTIVNPRNGPWTSVGPAFSFNNAGNIAFLGDISVNRQITSYALGTFTPPNIFSTPRPADVLTRPMLADNGSIAFKFPPPKDAVITVDGPTLRRSIGQN